MSLSFITLGSHAQPKRREKLFGNGRTRPLDRNAKVRLMVRARTLVRRTEPGKAYGIVTAKALAVLEALLWGFHNAKSGICFPSLERIAERAGCARSTVARALKALEAAGVLTWVNRIVRVRVRCRDLFGGEGSRVRVMRTSNAYTFTADPAPGGNRPEASKSDLRTGTSIQGFPLLPPASTTPSDPPAPDLTSALNRLGRLMGLV